MGGTGIVGIIGTAMTLAGKILDIIVEKGDDADDLRLKDIEGWADLKKSVRKKEALSAFKKAWRERHDKP
jgi:hypothetical protein